MLAPLPQLSYSTPSSESSGEAVGGQEEQEPSNEPSGEDQDKPTVDQPSNDETETEPTVSEPMDETNLGGLTPEEQQEQKQLALDIITSNGLAVVNETFPGVDGDATGSGTGTSNVGNTEKEVTCVKNSQGQVFCYETLPTEENCMKPVVEEDPPLCLKGQ